MLISVDNFFNQWNGKGIDFDNYYGNQCMDLAERYNRDVIGAPRLGGNAIDVWTNFPKDFYNPITNTPDGIPQKGDLVIWNIGQYGHIAVFSSGDVNDFISFDQNWPVQLDVNGNGIGVCHFQAHSNYANVVGWLRPKSLPQADTILVPKSDFENLVTKSSNWDTVATYFKLDSANADIGKMVIDKFEQIQKDLETCRTSLNQASIPAASGSTTPSTSSNSDNSPSGSSSGSPAVPSGNTTGPTVNSRSTGASGPTIGKEIVAFLQKLASFFHIFINNVLKGVNK